MSGLFLLISFCPTFISGSLFFSDGEVGATSLALNAHRQTMKRLSASCPRKIRAIAASAAEGQDIARSTLLSCFVGVERRVSGGGRSEFESCCSRSRQTRRQPGHLLFGSVYLYCDPLKHTPRATNTNTRELQPPTQQASKTDLSRDRQLAAGQLSRSKTTWRPVSTSLQMHTTA